MAGPVGAPNPIAGTIAGRAFTSGEVTVSGGHPTVVSIPLVDGADRIGLLELDYDVWDGALPAGWERVVAVFVLVLITKSRYGDLWVRARRSEPLSAEYSSLPTRLVGIRSITPSTAANSSSRSSMRSGTACQRC